MAQNLDPNNAVQEQMNSSPWDLINQILAMSPLAPIEPVSAGAQQVVKAIKGKQPSVSNFSEPQMTPTYPSGGPTDPSTDVAQTTGAASVQQSAQAANAAGPEAAPSLQHKGQMSPEDMEKTNPAEFQNTIKNNMLTVWKQQYGWMMHPTVTFEDFYNQIRGETNGFNPLHPMTAQILYPDSFDGADQFHKNALFAKNLAGVNFNAAMDYWPGGMGGVPEWAEDRLTSLGLAPKLKESKVEYQKLMAAISGAVPNASMPAIEKMFNNMRGTKTKAQAYTQFLNTMQNQLGVNITDLDQKGLTPEYFNKYHNYQTPANLQPQTPAAPIGE